jgi:hypothetical protein
MTPKPPNLLLRYIKEGRCIVFVGSGLSAGARLPTWKQLLLDVIAEMASALPGGEREEEELRKLVDQGKLLEVADHCKERMGSSFHTLLTDKLRGDKEAIPETFRLLMHIPFAAWVTTNYDKLLERAYSEELGGYPRVLTHMDTEPLGRLLFDDGKFVLKAHGDIDRHGTVVLTSRDYAEIIHSNPSFNAVFTSLLLTRALLFVGYSLSDPDFRLLLDRQFTAFKGFVPDRFALMCGLGQVEQDVLWRTARIRVLSYPEGQHGEVLNFLRLLKDAVQAPATVVTAPPSGPPQSAVPPTRGPAPRVAPTPVPGSVAPRVAAPATPGGTAPRVAAPATPGGTAPPPRAAPTTPAPGGVAPRAPAPAAVGPAAPASATPAPAAAPRVAMLDSTQDDASEEEATIVVDLPPSRIALGVGRRDAVLEAFSSTEAPRPASTEPLQLSLWMEGRAVYVRLARGASELLAQGRVPMAQLSEFGQRAVPILAGRGAWEERFRRLGELSQHLLTPQVQQALEAATDEAEGPPVILRLAPRVEMFPWEVLATRNGLLALRRPLVRAPLSLSDAARGLPSLHRPVRVLLVGGLPEAHASVERLAQLYAGGDAFGCTHLLGPEVTPERVLQELETGGGYDVIHFLAHVGYDSREAFLSFAQSEEDTRLTASALRPIFSRTPPALLVVDASFSAFLPARMPVSLRDLSQETGLPEGWQQLPPLGQAGFAQLAAETGVGTFLGSCGLLRGRSEAFATRLHQGLVAGESIAQAVFRARLEAHQAFPEDPSPLQYLLSGHGGLTLG